MSNTRHGEIVIHQNEDGSLQLRDNLSRFWCACGGAAVHHDKEDFPPYDFKCIKCNAKRNGLVSNTDKLQEIKQVLENELADELGLSDKWKDGTYIYCLTRCKEAFHVGTMTLDDFIEIDNDFLQQVLERAMLVVSPLISQLEQAQEEIERIKKGVSVYHDLSIYVETERQKIIDNLQAENEQLKADKQKLIEACKKIIDKAAEQNEIKLVSPLSAIAFYALEEVRGDKNGSS